MTTDRLAAIRERVERARTLKIEIEPGPMCPHCRCDGFDDWHRTAGLKTGSGIVNIYGRLKCHQCGKFFAIDHYTDGVVHSKAWVKERAKNE